MKGSAIDAYCHLNSPIHRWEPRTKLVSLFVLMLAFASVTHLSLLLAMLLLSGVLYEVSGLPLTFWRDRLRWPGTLLLLIAIVLPFSGGDTALWSLGPLTLYQEGLTLLLQLSIRIISLLTLGLVLFATTPFTTLIQAARSLGLPSILADMTLLSYRYLYELGEHLDQMQAAMRLRGLSLTRLNRQKFGILAALIGSLLIRSYEQSDRVYQAMRLRGYGMTTTNTQTYAQPSAIHLWAGVSTLAIAVCLVLLDTTTILTIP